MPNPRCKMRLYAISATGNGTVGIDLYTMYDPRVPEDVEISVIFPSGTIHLVVADVPTIEGLQIGAAYYLDFSLAAVQPMNILS